MNALRSKFYPHIGTVAILLAVIGLTAQVVLVLFPESTYLYYFIPIRFSAVNVLPRLIGHNAHLISLPTILFHLMMLVGGLVHRRNKGNVGLLGFVFSVLFVDLMIRVISRPLKYLHWQLLFKNSSSFDGDAPGFFQMHWTLLYMVPLMFLTFYFVKWLLSEDRYNIDFSMGDDGIESKSHDLVSPMVRCLHWFVDLLFMWFLIVPFFQFLLNFGESYRWDLFLKDASLGKGLLSIAIMVIMFIYYIIFEGLFGVTPIKLLTGTRVVHDETLKRSAFRDIILRSICRFIPLEAFTFLGKRGLHDTISNTTLVYVENRGQSRTYHRWWIVVLLVITFAPSSLQSVLRKQNQKIIKTFNKEVAKRALIATTKVIDKGDFITCIKRKNRYSNRLSTLLHVIEATTDSLTVNIYESKLSAGRKHKDLHEIVSNQEPIAVERSFRRQALIGDHHAENELNKGLNIDDELKKLEYYLRDQPFFKCNRSSASSGGKGSTSSFRVRYPAGHLEIKNLKVLKGDLEWNDVNLIDIETYSETKTFSSFNLEASNIHNKKSTLTEMRIKYNGVEMTYIIEGLGTNIKFYRKN